MIQRDDDKPESVRNRLKVYENTMSPVIQFYKEKKLLEEFAGTETNEIWPRVHKYLSSKISPIEL